MDDFIQKQGPAFLAHLLRRLSDDLVQQAADWYPTAGVTAPPRTISTLLALDEHGPLAITELAKLLRQSHPLVIVWVRELSALSFIESNDCPNDRRRTLISLTIKGRNQVKRVRRALVAMENASQRLLQESGADLLPALWRMEKALREKPFADRLAAG